jgi:hypothetical protein
VRRRLEDGPAGWTRAFAVPDSYLREHSELAYARNDTVVQGRTAEAGRLVPGQAQLDREAFHVGMTRGSGLNAVYLDVTRGGEPLTRQPGQAGAGPALRRDSEGQDLGLAGARAWWQARRFPSAAGAPGSAARRSYARLRLRASVARAAPAANAPVSGSQRRAGGAAGGGGGLAGPWRRRAIASGSRPGSSTARSRYSKR